MKISKQRIQEIIKEELALAESDEQVSSDEQGANLNPPDEEKDISTRQGLSVKFKELSKIIKDAEGIDSAEAKLINAIVNHIIKLSDSGKSKEELIVALRKLGVKV